MTNNTDKNSNETRSRAQSKIEQLPTNTNPNGQNTPQPSAELVEPVVFKYTRMQALADGVQVEATELAAEAGFVVRVFLTASLYEQYIKVPNGVTGQDEKGRLWDVIWMLRYAIRKAASDAHRIRVELYVRNSDQKPAELVFLYAEVGPVDFDDLRPCLTVMLPDED